MDMIRSHPQNVSPSAPTRPCPVCQADTPDFLAHLHMPLFDSCPIRGDFDLCTCPRCGLVYSATASTPEDFADFYRRYYFVRAYEGYLQDPEWRRHSGELIECLLQHGVDPEGRVVDVGAGPGHLLIRLRENGFQDLLGVEVCAEHVELMQARGLRAELGNVDDFDLAPASTSCLIYSHLLEHLWDYESVFAHMKRVLRPDGQVLVEVPDLGRYHSIPGWQPLTFFLLEHLTHFARCHLDALFARHGFEAQAGGVRTLWRGDEFPFPVQYVLYRRTDREQPALPAPEEVQPLVARVREWFEPQPWFVSAELGALAASGAPVHVWGLTYRTCAWLGMSDLARCHIAGLYDMDERKQQRTLLGQPVQPPDALFELGPEHTVVIGVGPAAPRMRQLLRAHRFSGQVVTLR